MAQGPTRPTELRLPADAQNYSGQQCANAGIQTIGESDDRDEDSRQARAVEKVMGKVLSGRMSEQRDVSALRVRPRLAHGFFRGVSSECGAPFFW